VSSLPGRLAVLLARLDRIRPPRGPCGICGGHDARHRIWDSIDDQSRTSDGVAGTARWLHVTVAEVRLVRAAFDEARRRHTPLPGRCPLPTPIRTLSDGLLRDSSVSLGRLAAGVPVISPGARRASRLLAGRRGRARSLGGVL